MLGGVFLTMVIARSVEVVRFCAPRRLGPRLVAGAGLLIRLPGMQLCLRLAGLQHECGMVSASDGS